MKKNHLFFDRSAYSIFAPALLAFILMIVSLCAALSLCSFAASLDAYGATPMENTMESDTDATGGGRNLKGIGNGTDMDMDMGMDSGDHIDNTDNGKVLDGDRGDRAGVIGDEKETDTGEVRGATDEGNGGDGTFWGIVIALAIAAAVILLIALILPKEKNTSGGTRK